MLSAFASRWHDGLAGLAAAAERLTQLSAPGERAVQRRLSMLSLLVPLLLAGGLVQTLADALGATRILALVAVVIASGWLSGLTLGMTGRRRLVETLLLGIIIATCAAIIAGAGGLASPFAVIAAMPLVEAAWVRRDRAGLLAGVVGSLLVLPLQAALQLALDLQAITATAWHWLVPAAYLATVIVRAAAFVADREKLAALHRPLAAEDVIEAAFLRLSKGGDVLDAAGRAGPLLGLSPALLLGAGLFERIHVGDRVAYLCALSDLREGAERRVVSLRLRAPRGANDTDESYRAFAAEIVATGDDAAPLIAVLRRDEETAALRNEIASLQGRAEEIDLAKSRFLAVVSHELRTPLNAIVGFSDMLAHEMFGPFADPRQKEYAGLIRESGNHLLAVVTSILDVSKIECGSYSIEPEAFVFRDAVEMCGAMMKLQADAKSLELKTEIAPAVGSIVADRRAVQQMLINLISNAIKFTPSGGSVTVGASRLGSRLHFWVSDTGIGISEDDLGRLGRPFTQLRNDYTREFDGAGLGLSLVKGLVSLHDGSMMIDSAPGEGTLVTISLPLAGPSTRKPGSGAKIIPLKDDEAANGQIRKIA